MDEAAPKGRARPLGRSRVADSPADPVREGILNVAANLFEVNGFSATSVEAIANAAGLSPGSVVDHFTRKEDILLELLGQAVRPTLKAVRQTRLEQHDPDVALWQLVSLDVAIICRGPRNVGALQLLPEARGPEFAWYWRRRHQLFRVYADQIARGFLSGVFTLGEPQTASEVVFGLVESVIIARPQFRRRTSTPAVLADASLSICGVSAERIRQIATSLTS
jgi:AcrR family transcriptional regulator